MPAPPARRLKRPSSCAAARVLKAQKPVESAISGTAEGSSGVAAIGGTFACLAGDAVRESLVVMITSLPERITATTDWLVAIHSASCGYCLLRWEFGAAGFRYDFRSRKFAYN